MNQPPNNAPPPFGYQPAFHQGPYPYPAGSYPVDIVNPNTQPAVWAPYNGQQGVGAEEDEDENILTKKVGPLPVWGWAAGLAILGIGGYYVYTQLQPGGALAKNDESKDEDEDDAAPVRPNGQWSPSRSGFGTQVDSFLKQNGIKGVKVFLDADDAAKVVKTPSPLVTLRTNRAAPLHTNPQFVALCEAEGLKPIETADNVVGLYPNRGKRGKAWEKYIDDLRDEGQSI